MRKTAGEVQRIKSARRLKCLANEERSWAWNPAPMILTKKPQVKSLRIRPSYGSFELSPQTFAFRNVLAWKIDFLPVSFVNSRPEQSRPLSRQSALIISSKKLSALRYLGDNFCHFSNFQTLSVKSHSFRTAAWGLACWELSLRESSRKKRIIPQPDTKAEDTRESSWADWSRREDRKTKIAGAAFIARTLFQVHGKWINRTPSGNVSRLKVERTTPWDLNFCFTSEEKRLADLQFQYAYRKICSQRSLVSRSETNARVSLNKYSIEADPSPTKLGYYEEWCFIRVALEPWSINKWNLLDLRTVFSKEMFKRSVCKNEQKSVLKIESK